MPQRKGVNKQVSSFTPFVISYSWLFNYWRGTPTLPKREKKVLGILGMKIMSIFVGWKCANANYLNQ